MIFWGGGGVENECNAMQCRCQISQIEVSVSVSFPSGPVRFSLVSIPFEFFSSLLCSALLFSLLLHYIT